MQLRRECISVKKITAPSAGAAGTVTKITAVKVTEHATTAHKNIG